LVNYHKLDYKTLEALIYTYLGDWIGRQKRDADNGVDGAQEKLAAAEALKKRLELILAGESALRHLSCAGSRSKSSPSAGIPI
jgi:hypothetical protein